MSKLKVVWSTEVGRWSDRLVGKTGKYTAFTIAWDGMSSKNENNKYKLVCNLHGIKTNLGNFSTEESAKAYAEDKVTPLWLEGLGITLDTPNNLK